MKILYLVVHALGDGCGIKIDIKNIDKTDSGLDRQNRSYSRYGYESMNRYHGLTVRERFDQQKRR